MNQIPHEDVDSVLRAVGADDDLVVIARECADEPQVRDMVNRFKSYAEKNSTAILAALSALVVGVAAEEIVRRKTATKRRTPSKKRSTKARASSKRTLIEPHAGDKRYIRRDAHGRIRESVDVGRSLSADRRRHSKRSAKSGEGDRGDRR